MFWSRLFCPTKIHYHGDVKTILRNRKVKGVILVSNHKYRVDPFPVSLVLPEIVHFFATDELLKPQQQRDRFLDKSTIKPLWFRYIIGTIIAFLTKLLIGNSHTILVDRNNTAARINRLAVTKASQLLKEGKIVGIFPQAETERNEGRPIAISLARKTRALIVPVCLAEKPCCWNRDNPWKIFVGKPLSDDDLEKYISDGKGDSGRQLMEHILQLPQLADVST